MNAKQEAVQRLDDLRLKLAEAIRVYITAVEYFAARDPEFPLEPIRLAKALMDADRTLGRYDDGRTKRGAGAGDSGLLG